MAEIIGGDQPLRRAVMSPASDLTRIAGALAIVKAPAVRAFGYTGSLGNTLLLKKIRVWFVPVWPASIDWIDFWIRFGIGTPATYGEISNWENILPINWLGSGPLGYRELATGRVFEWTMNRRFTAESIRFGIQIEAAPSITYEEMYITFEISEG